MFLGDLEPGDLTKIRPDDPLGPEIIWALTQNERDAAALFRTTYSLTRRAIALRHLARSPSQKFLRHKVRLVPTRMSGRKILTLTAGSLEPLASHTTFVAGAMRGSAYSWTYEDEARLVYAAEVLHLNMHQ